MRKIKLFEIDWDRANHALPAQIDYVMDDQACAAWNDIFDDSLHLPPFEARMLLRDVFRTQAERDHDCDIKFCKIWVGAPEGGEDASEPQE